MKKFTDFKPHHFNGDDFFNFNKFIQNNENDTVFQNKDFKIILVGENLKKAEILLAKMFLLVLKRKKPLYMLLNIYEIYLKTIFPLRCIHGLLLWEVFSLFLPLCGNWC